MAKEKENLLAGELFSFKTADGLRLHGFRIASRRGNKKAIINIHGMNGNFYRSNLMRVLGKELKGTEYDLILVNTRGNGLVITTRVKGAKRIIGTAFEKFEDSVKDVGGAISFAQKIGYKEFILCGHSTGCQKIIYYHANKNDKKVRAFILLAPADDYGLAKKRLGKNFRNAVRQAKRMAALGKGNQAIPKWTGNYSAKRFLSYADEGNPEGQIFNYSGKLELYSKIKQPILAIFGSKEEHSVKTPREMLQILREKSCARVIYTKEVKGANHSFKGKERKTAQEIIKFIRKI